MRILLITDHHKPTGGAEKYFFELKEKLQIETCHDVFSLGFDTTDKKGKDYQTLAIASSNWSKLLWQLLPHPRITWRLKKAIRQFNPDVIHLHNIKQQTAALLRAVQGYPVIQTVHDYHPVCPTSHNIHKNFQPCETGFQRACFWQHQLKFNRLIYLALTASFLLNRRRLKKTIRQFITVSPPLERQVKAHYPQPVTYIPPFIQKDHDNRAITPMTGHFLFAGVLDKHKGVILLLDEFALALKKRPDLHLTLAGTGPEETRLKRLSAAYGIQQQITFAGWQTDLTLLYQTHFAAIVPSIWMEAFGLVLTEAMAHQRPVIGSNRGAIPWLVADGQTGLIFDPVKKGDLAAKMLTLANQPELARQWGLCGQLKLHRMINNEKSLQHLLKLYETTRLNTPDALNLVT